MNFEEFAKERKNDSPEFTPGFILFYQPDNLEQRVENIKTIYPNLYRLNGSISFNAPALQKN